MRSPDTSDHKIDEWARKELTSWNPDSPEASYGELIEKLFLTAGDRQREIERLCDEGHNRSKPFPDFGYAVLSSLMCQHDGRFNVALTTNFDDLLTDAFFYFQEVRPLVIHHDSLAPFIRPTYSRPLLVKLHGDHRLAPRNTSAETESLAEIVAQRVSTVLHDRGIIFLGYGGNDESIISMMERLPDEAIPFGVYWVSSSEPRGIFRPWLESRGAVWVENGNFDELMFRLRNPFDIKEPSKDRYESVLTRYAETHRKLLQGIVTGPKKAADDSLLKAALANAVSQKEPKFAESLFEAAIRESPKSCDLCLAYANFLVKELGEFDRAEALYKRALEVDSKNAMALSSYGNFLVSQRNDLERAEELFKRAVDSEPDNTVVLSNFANFLADERKDVNRADEFYKRAINADFKNPDYLRSYAKLLIDDPTELGEPEDLVARGIYKRAVKWDFKTTSPLTNYANFLCDSGKTWTAPRSSTSKPSTPIPKMPARSAATRSSSATTARI